MITIKLRDRDGKLVELQGTSSSPITLSTQNSSTATVGLTVSEEDGVSKLTPSATTLQGSDWYELFIADKLKAMLDGGESAYYSFQKGLRKLYINSSVNQAQKRSRIGGDNAEGVPYIRSVNGCPPIGDGQLFILGDENVTMYPDDGQLKLCVPPTTNGYQKMLEEIYSFTWLLYHAYNHLFARLVRHRTDSEDDSNWSTVDVSSKTYEGGDNLGYSNGTLLEYQAQVAMYNLEVWKSSFLFQVDTVSEKAAIGVGYFALDCGIKSVKIKLSIHTTTAAKDEKLREALNALTIFCSGKSVSYGKKVVNTGEICSTVTMSKLFNSSIKTIYGTGYESDPRSREDGLPSGGSTGSLSAGDVWNSIDIDIDIEDLPQGARYYEVFSLAVSTGAFKSLQLPETITETSPRIPLVVKASWEIKYTDGAKQNISKETAIQPLAVNVLEEEE